MIRLVSWYRTLKTKVQAYRSLDAISNAESDRVPLVLHTFFRANMNFWDPVLLEGLRKDRSVVIFDPAGVGRSDGAIRPTRPETHILPEIA